MTWKIKYSESSKEDLKSIFGYISLELGAPKAAGQMAERIMKAIRSLEKMPMRHQIYNEEPWKSQQIRFFPVNKYIIFYLPKEELKTVFIVRIIYGGRDLKHQPLDLDDDVL